MKIRLACLLSLFSAALIAATIYPPAPKAKFTETVRYESRTIRESFGSSATASTESASRGKWSLTIEVPLEEADVQSIGPDTVFQIKAGRLVSSAPLSLDPKYKVGGRSAQLDLSHNNDARYPPVAVAKLKWSKDKLTIQVSPKKKDSPPLMALSFVNSPEGVLQGTSKLSVALGQKSHDLEIAYTGTLKRKSVDLEEISGQAVDIELKGETLP